MRSLGRRGHDTVWECRCDCGVIFEATAGNLRAGNFKSCGCHRRRVSTEKATTHGKSYAPVYQVWNNMMRRCYEPTNEAYPDYGGRGITVCQRWHTFENFLTDMGEPALGMTIERRANNGNYEPNNCRWATRREQNRNKREHVYLEIGGERKLLVEWAEQSGIQRLTLWHRKFTLGWPESRLLSPVRGSRPQA